jgi:alanine dehydrogenase
MRGHEVFVQKGAGVGSGLADEEYAQAGATLLETAEEVWARAELICKVKEPLPSEFRYLRSGQTLYTYLHLAAAPELAREMVQKGTDSVAYETLALDDGRLPLLQPMSAVAGRMAIQIGAVYLQKELGGKGVLLGGVSGVRRGKIAILGGGVVGSNAARMAIGLGADVTVLDINIDTLSYLDDIYQGRCHTIYSDPNAIEQAVQEADLVVGAVLVPGAKAPKLVTREMIAKMEPGSVVVDVAVDQGGCIETCRPTTHDAPTYVVDGVTHYCVANMPGAVPHTSTHALANATIPYLLKLASLGLERAAREQPAIARGINTWRGHVVHAAVAEAVGLPFKSLAELLR